MSVYNYVVAKNTSGEDITVSVEFEHTKRELRCLAVMHDEDAYQWAIINAGKLVLLSEGQYSVPYPFSVKLKPWSVYIWRSTTEDEDVLYDGTRVPVEAIVAKLAELSRKVDENKREVGRALRTPEGASDSFVPPEDVRAGKILGFDDDGKPAVGSNVPQVGELFEVQNTCENLAEEARASASAAASSATEAKGLAEKAAASAADADESADNAKLYYDKTVSVYQKVDEAVAKGTDEIEQVANNAKKEISLSLNEHVELAKDYASRARASAVQAGASAQNAQGSVDECKQIASLLAKGFQYKIVAALPSVAEANTVYFVGNDASGYKMYIWVE